jgi:A/G-specific adenine glycosylase
MRYAGVIRPLSNRHWARAASAIFAPMQDPESLTSQLLAWYDAHARVMPWRVSPQDRARVRPDPYRVWLSEVMLQQTTVAAVKDYFHRFTARWPTVQRAGRGRGCRGDGRMGGSWLLRPRPQPAEMRARRAVADHGGQFPTTRETLLTLPGIGPYTASAIAAIAFDQPATVVDGNVERVMCPAVCASKPASRRQARTHQPGRPPDPAGPSRRLCPGDDGPGRHDLHPAQPGLRLCPLGARLPCPRAWGAGRPAAQVAEAGKTHPAWHALAWPPRRSDPAGTPPRQGPARRDAGYSGRRWDGQGGQAPAEADWQDIGEVRHTFTHFHLILSVHVARLDTRPRAAT